MSEPPVEEKLEQDEFEEMVETGRYFKELKFLHFYPVTHIQTLVAMERLRRAIIYKR